MKIHNMDQRSEKWRDIRLGIPTASQAHRIITPSGKASTSARAYLYEKVYERIFRKPWQKDLSNIAAVQEGIRNEPIAAQKFAAEHQLDLETVGFVTTDDGWIGCSPDRLVLGRNEIVEIKCPLATTHIGYIIDGAETEYYAQMQCQLLVSEGRWDRVHFYSYHPEIAPFYRVVERDVAFQDKLASLLKDFIHELIRNEQHVREHGVYPKDAPSNFPPEEGELAF